MKKCVPPCVPPLIGVLIVFLIMAAYVLVPYFVQRVGYEPAVTVATVVSVGDSGVVLSYPDTDGYGEDKTSKVSNAYLDTPLAVGDKVEYTFNDGYFVALFEGESIRVSKIT